MAISEQYEETNLSESIASLEDSPVRMSVCQELEQEWAMELGAASGLSSSESLASYDPVTSSWRTSQVCLFQPRGVAEHRYQEFLETWPRSGTMRNGKLFQLLPLALPTAASESGSLRTPMARDQKDLSSQGKTYACQRERHQPSLVTESYLAEVGGPIAEVYEWAMGFERGWTDPELEHSVMLSSHKSPNGSAEES